MAAPTVTDGTILLRRLDVMVRVTDAVAEMVEDHHGGLLLETYIGRFVLDSDGRKVWRLIDGRRSVSEIVGLVASDVGAPPAEVANSVHELCGQLLELGLVDDAARGDGYSPPSG